MLTYLPYADLDLKLEQERARLTDHLPLANRLDQASVAELADVLPFVAEPVDAMVQRVPRRLGAPPDPAAR